VSGFVAPDLIRERTAADPADRSAWHALLAYNFLLNQAFAKVGVAAFSGAMIFWSASLPRSGALARTAQVLGIAIGTATLLVLGHGSSGSTSEDSAGSSCRRRPGSSRWRSSSCALPTARQTG
jgi:hypothetical protein